MNDQLNQTTKKRRAKPDPWQPIRDRVGAFAAEHNLSVEPRKPTAPQYQIALLTAVDVRLVVYPHTTRGSGGCHARIRDENSRDKVAAERLMTLSGLWIKNKGAWTAQRMKEVANG